MPDPSTPAVPRDRPEAYLPRDRRQALATGAQMPDRVHGAALFADISGFTPLTEALAAELGPQRGAEELTVHIGRVFHEVIGELDAFDGNVIYFSGDAITCWIDGDDGSRACAAALRMQAAIQRTGTITTPAGAQVVLAMKIAIAVGGARRFLVGDPDVQLIDVLAGSLIDDLAAVEHHADRGEIVLDASAVASLGSRAVVGEPREDTESGRRCRPLLDLAVDVAPVPFVEPAALPEDLVRPWLLPAVYERMRTGRGEFLTELRPAIPVFVRFGGIDYDADDDAIGKLDEFIRASQRVLTSFGGNLLQLTLGDKGAYLYGVFGSPHAHEDDAARAAAAALDLRDLEQTTAARGIQVGLAHGRLRSGTYGHEMRRTFVCLGDAVNLAARLMAAAPQGSIYASAPVQEAAGDGFIWDRLPDLRLKGKAEPVPAWALAGSLERASRRRRRFELSMVGRTRELAALERGLTGALDQRGTVVGIAAEAGMGKSRLVAEFVRNVRRRGHVVAFGECQAYGTRTPYFVWREIWRRLFGLEDQDPPERQLAAIQRYVAAIDPSLVARVPLLEEVVGLSIPDSELTRTFDAKLRKASLEDLLATCLRARALEAPFVAVLEDCHWIDELSRDLLAVLARSASALPVLFVLAYRPAAAPGGALGIDQLAGFTELTLDRMEPAEVATLVRAKLAQLAGSAQSARMPGAAEAAVSGVLADRIADRSGGNPFYVEELLSYIVAQGVDPADPVAAEAVELPESLNGLVLGRIDSAGEEPRRTLKVASVVGRVFGAPVLPGAYAELGTLDRVVSHLHELRGLDLVTLDRETDQAWLFKHGVTQEVAYESLPFALRTDLHGRVGDYLERTEPDLERAVPLLEHHFWRSDREAKKREYLWKAALAAQAAYANQAAIAYLDRLIPLLDGADRVEAVLRLAQVLHVLGEMPRAAEALDDARTTARAASEPVLAARVDHLAGETARRLGRFDEALELLERASREFTEAGDEAGTADVLQVMGTVNAQRGNLDVARERYQAGLAIRERLGDEAGVAALANNLGIVAQQEGRAEEARRYAAGALDAYRRVGDGRRIASCEVNLAWMDGMAGDHESERAHCEEAIRLSIQVGDRLNLALAQNNLGDALRDLGRLNEAGLAYAAAVELYRDLGDLGPLMALFEDVAALASLRGDHDSAFRLVGAADALRASLGSARTPDAEAALDTRLAAALAGLGAPAADRARRAGALLTADAAIALAVERSRAESA